MTRFTCILGSIILLLMLILPASAARDISIVSFFDTSGKQGAALADIVSKVVADVNAQGGINGSTIKLISVDTKSDPNRAAEVLRSIVEKERVSAVVGPTSLVELLACLPVIEDAQVPVVCCVGQAGAVVPVEQRKWVFKTPHKSAAAVERIYTYLAERSLRNVGFLIAKDKYGSEGIDLLTQNAMRHKINIMAREGFRPTDPDAFTAINAIAASKPQAMIIWASGSAGAVAAKSAKQLNVPFTVVLSEAQADTQYIKSAGNSANGTLLPVTKLLVADQLPDSDKQKALCQAFAKQLPDSKSDICVNYGYARDAIRMIVDALRKVGPDPKKLRTALENMKDYVGVSGVYDMSAKDHCGVDSSSLVMVEVREGSWKLAK